MSFRFEVKGLDELRRNLRKLGNRANDALVAAMYGEGAIIMRASKRLVPVDEGTLRSTGHIAPPMVNAGRVTIKLRYGGPAAPYALAQHERLDYAHNPPTQAKYLETPAKAAASGMARRVARRVKLRLERLG